MCKIQTHDLPELVGLVLENPKTSNAMRTFPGDPCSHKSDRTSYGIILSRRWGPDDKPMQCEVLWSREPKLFIPIDATPVTTRLRSDWAQHSVEQIAEWINCLDTQIVNDVRHGKPIEKVIAEDPDILDVKITHGINRHGIVDLEIKRRSRETLINHITMRYGEIGRLDGTFYVGHSSAHNDKFKL